MKTIRSIRLGLERIPGTLVEFPPEFAFRGTEPGMATTTIWNDLEGENDDRCAPEWTDDSIESNDPDAGGIPNFEPLIELGADVDETFPALAGEEGERIRQSVLRHGIDALGWYSSFHYTGVQWGIYIPVSGLIYTIREVFGPLPVPLMTKAHLAFHAILNHELFHFATDYTMAQAELIHREPWWLPMKTAFMQENPPYYTQEEKLANAYMLKAFRTMKPSLRVRGKQEALRAFVRNGPAGYCDGHLVEPEGWGRNLEQLAHAYVSHSEKGSRNFLLEDHDGFEFGYDWPAQFPIRPRIDWRYCPIHLVHDGARLGVPNNWLNFFSRLDAIEESDDFRENLRKLAPPIQQAWMRTKGRLQVAITRGADFKKWTGDRNGLWSVRVNDSFRVHLRREPAGSWMALKIGNHKEMGHG